MDIKEKISDRINELCRIQKDFRERSRIDPVWEGYLICLSNELHFLENLLKEISE
jgi:hypothetical protein